MALNNLYVLDFKQQFQQEDIHNIFTYESDGDGSAADLNDAFNTTMLPLINAIQSSNIANVSARTINLGSLSDIDEKPLSGLGALTGSDMLPLHDAVNYTLKPTTRAVRPGSKRFSGLVEVDQVDGIITASAYITSLNALRVGIDTPIAAGMSINYATVIIKRVKYNPDPDQPLKFAYRFPHIGEVPVVASLSGVLLNLKITHQTSRK